MSLRVPRIVNLRSDPFERAPEDATMFYDRWMAGLAFLLVPAQMIVGEFLKTFNEFAPTPEACEFQCRSGFGESSTTREGIGKLQRAANRGGPSGFAPSRGALGRSPD